MKIITHENEILRKKSQIVEDIYDDKIKKLVEKMVQAMKKNKGIGLAAPQIGVLKRVITIETKDGPFILINPKITKYSEEQEVAEEGCLSIPGKYDKVQRPANITYTGQLLSGEKINETAEGLFARVLQHEVDHLDGILFIDRVK